MSDAVSEVLLSVDGLTAGNEILALLRSLVRKLGTSLLLITHDPGVLSAIAGRALVMYAGQIVESGSVGEILRSPLHPYTRALLRSMLHHLDATRICGTGMCRPSKAVRLTFTGFRPVAVLNLAARTG